ERALNIGIVPPAPVAFVLPDEFEHFLAAAVHPSLESAHGIMADSDDPVARQSVEPGFPGRLAGEEDRPKTSGHVSKPPRLVPMRILEGNERELSPVAVQERLAVSEIRIAKVEGADRGIAAALERIVEINSAQLLVL